MTLFGWDKPVPCRACTQPVWVRSFSVMAWTAPFIAFTLCASVLQAFRLISWDAVLVLVLALLFAAMGVGGLLFGVALGKKGRTDAQLVQRAQAAAAARR